MEKKYFKKGINGMAKFATKNNMRNMSKVERDLYNEELEKLYDSISKLCFDFYDRWTYGHK